MKLTRPDLDPAVEFTHPNVWQREQHPGWSRLRIGAREREIALILQLCQDFRGPFSVLYVLLASGRGRERARYRSQAAVGFEVLELFLYTFQEFFEQDGRHHLWVMAKSGEGQLAFDQHNILYAYGDLPRYEDRLEAAGFRPGPVETPTPHEHHCHARFDPKEDEIVAYWDWVQLPLQSTDDDGH